MIELAGSAAHVVVESVEAVALDPADLHHLGRVLRLRAGERVTATDGRGGWRWCRWTGDGLEPDGETAVAPAPTPPLAVAFALIKGDGVDWTVQKLTEVGVDTIIPMTTQRCVVRWDGAHADRQVDRLRRIVRASAMQSRRVWLPSVEPVTELDAVLSRPAAVRADDSVRWLGDPGHLEVSLVAVGPEGGWSATEREQYPSAVRLSDQVLRAETAAVVAGAVLVEHRRTFTSR